MSDVPSKHFIAYWPVFWFIFVAALVGGTAYLYIVDGREVQLVPALAGLGAAFATCLLATWLMVRLQPVKVSAAALHAINWLQLPAAAEWSECEQVTARRMLGFRFLRIQKSKGLPVWVPAFLARPQEFRDAVLARVDAEHPLAVAVLDQWGGPPGGRDGSDADAGA